MLRRSGINRIALGEYSLVPTCQHRTCGPNLVVVLLLTAAAAAVTFRTGGTSLCRRLRALPHVGTRRSREVFRFHIPGCLICLTAEPTYGDSGKNAFLCVTLVSHCCRISATGPISFFQKSPKKTAKGCGEEPKTRSSCRSCVHTRKTDSTTLQCLIDKLRRHWGRVLVLAATAAAAAAAAAAAVGKQQQRSQQE